MSQYFRSSEIKEVEMVLETSMSPPPFFVVFFCFLAGKIIVDSCHLDLSNQQCRCRKTCPRYSRGCSTADMVHAVRHIQKEKKSIKQKKDLYAVFMHSIKAVDAVSGEVL